MRSQPLLFLATVLLVWCAARVIHHLPRPDTPRDGLERRSFPDGPGFQPYAQPRSQPEYAGLSGVQTLLAPPALATDRLVPDESAVHRSPGRPPSASFDIALAHQIVWAEALTTATGAAGDAHSVLTAAPLLVEPEPSEPHRAADTTGHPTNNRDRRWSIYGWSLLRASSRVRTLAPAGQYGGSQAGLVLRYTVRGAPVATEIYARAVAAVARDDDRTLAIGIAARPWSKIPVDLAVERRFGLAERQRDRFAAMVLAGGGVSLGGSRIRIDGYGQAGFVGWNQRQAFFDLQMLATRPVTVQDGPAVLLGGGLWAGGQQERDPAGHKRWVHRADLGPRAALDLPVGDSRITVAFDWRQRIDGNAQPGSGAVVTVSAGF